MYTPHQPAFASPPMMRPSSGNGVTRDMTAGDYSSYLQTQGTGGLLVEFFYLRVRFGGETGPYAGKFETRLCVAKQPRGDRLTVAVSYITEAEAQQQFPAEWQMFKTYMDTPTRGTPLHELPGATQSMVAILVLHGIRSIEDLAVLPADVASQIGLDATTARNLALRWIDLRDGNSQEIANAERLAKMEAELALLREQNATLARNNDVLERTNQSLRGMQAGGPVSIGQQAMQAPIVMGQTFEGMQMVNSPDFDGDSGADIFAGSPEVVGGLSDLPPDPLGS